MLIPFLLKLQTSIFSKYEICNPFHFLVFCGIDLRERVPKSMFTWWDAPMLLNCLIEIPKVLSDMMNNYLNAEKEILAGK